MGFSRPFAQKTGRDFVYRSHQEILQLKYTNLTLEKLVRISHSTKNIACGQLRNWQQKQVVSGPTKKNRHYEV